MHDTHPVIVGAFTGSTHIRRLARRPGLLTVVTQQQWAQCSPDMLGIGAKIVSMDMYEFIPHCSQLVCGCVTYQNGYCSTTCLIINPTCKSLIGISIQLQL